MIFPISITEVLNKTVLVEANSKEEALKKADHAYSEGIINLDYDNIQSNAIELETSTIDKGNEEYYQKI